MKALNAHAIQIGIPDTGSAMRRAWLHVRQASRKRRSCSVVPPTASAWWGRMAHAPAPAPKWPPAGRYGGGSAAGARGAGRVTDAKWTTFRRLSRCRSSRGGWQVYRHHHSPRPCYCGAKLSPAGGRYDCHATTTALFGVNSPPDASHRSAAHAGLHRWRPRRPVPSAHNPPPAGARHRR